MEAKCIEAYIPTCHCADKEGYDVVLNSSAHIGVTTRYRVNGAFRDHMPLYLPNRFCPACGAKREVIILAETNVSK